MWETDDEDLGQLKNDNGGDSSTDSKYNDVDNYGSISTNISIPEAEQNNEPVALAVQEDRPKQKMQVGPEISLDTALGKTNFDEFESPISNEFLESNIDKIPYKWTAPIVSTGRCNTVILLL